MKPLIMLLSFLLSTSLATADSKTDVSAVLDALHIAASKAESKTYFGLFAGDAVFIGTDVSEYWTLEEFKAYTLPYFSRGQGWTYHSKKRDIQFSPSGKVAWFHEVLHSESYGTTRGTGVLILEQGQGWRIAQYHLTIPIPNELAGEMTERIKTHEAEAAAQSQ